MRSQFLILPAVLLLAYGALILAYPEVTVSPGDLIRPHEHLASDCFSCHAPLRGTPSAHCTSCHELEAIGISTTTGEPIEGAEPRTHFHQGLSDTRCVACHGDHAGPDLAGALVAFSHELLAVDLRENCSDCHAQVRPDDELHRGAGQDCAACHETEAWTPASFDHEQLFRFDRHHASSDCSACHPDEFTRYDCYGCHEHSPRGVEREHREEGIRDFENCVECHRSGDEDEAERLYRKSRGRSRGGHDDDD